MPFTDEDIKDQRGEVTCSRSHRQVEAWKCLSGWTDVFSGAEISGKLGVFTVVKPIGRDGE